DLLCVWETLEEGEAGSTMQVVSAQSKAITGLAFTRKLQANRKSLWKTYDRPNIVTGSNVQDCWEKFARYQSRI
ncbi:glutamate decarboxylase, partial [Tanacetum coccineum]